MGNCLRKRAHDPNKPIIHISEPVSAVDGIISDGKKRSKSFQKRTTSNALKEEEEDQCKVMGCANIPLQERNSNTTSISESNSLKEKHTKGGKNDASADSPANPKEWPVSKVNKKEEIFHAYNLHCFCYSVLKSATQKFSKRNLIGEGGFGHVYKGYINFCTMNACKPSDNGFAIAVKRLRSIRQQGQSEWLNEMNYLSKLHHPNIVKLLGYCCDGEHRMLVYEYMSKGSLEAHLLRENETRLDWRRRIKIAVGAAKGLEYLHTLGKPVIHRDLKASNILLDSDFIAKISDFGLARSGPKDGETHVTTRILGTRGYFAPEYVATGHLTLQTDVFSFGVVLLEILSGCGAIKTYTDGAGGNLAAWAKPYLSNKREIYRVLDKKLGRIPIEEIDEFAKIILGCLRLNPKARPPMTQVVADLKKLQHSIESCNTAQLHYLRTRR